MLRERIKQMDLKVTELSDYLQISRPTMYKFIEYYDEQNFDLINRKVLKLFNYISENEFIGKKTVISYILNNLVELKPIGEKNDVSVINKLRKNIVENPESKKSKFLEIYFLYTSYIYFYFFNFIYSMCAFHCAHMVILQAEQLQNSVHLVSPILFFRILCIWKYRKNIHTNSPCPMYMTHRHVNGCAILHSELPPILI